MEKLDLQKAIDIATKAHHGQMDNSGIDYIMHPLTVMSFVRHADEKCVAVLHDVIEDTEVTLSDLIKEGFPLSIVNAIDLLTKTEIDKINYFGYLQRIKRNKLARTVKLADFKHNSDTSRLKGLEKNDIERLKKYKDSISFLSMAICENCQKDFKIKDVEYFERGVFSGFYCKKCQPLMDK